jgi:hypothetical protein
MNRKHISLQIKKMPDKKIKDEIFKIMNTMVPVSPILYGYQKIDSPRVWINDDDYFEKVYVKKFDTYGILFIYHNTEVNKFCSLDALFLPKSKMFEEEWDRIKDKLFEIELSDDESD